jgi:amidase
LHRDRLSPALRDGRIRDGERCRLEDYIASQRRAEEMRAWADEMFAGADAILTLAAPGEAPVGLAETGAATFNSLWTLLYTPCVTLPFAKASSWLAADTRTSGCSPWLRGLSADWPPDTSWNPGCSRRRPSVRCNSPCLA